MESIKKHLQKLGYKKTFDNMENVIDNGRIMISFVQDQITIIDKQRSSGLEFSQCYFNLFHGKVDNLTEFKTLMKQLSI